MDKNNKTLISIVIEFIISIPLGYVCFINSTIPNFIKTGAFILMIFLASHMAYLLIGLVSED